MYNNENDYLYHYTTVSSLALILKNRNFKFNPLTVLDDLEEQKIRDSQQYGKYCFVSSWTNDDKESIPMWNMYTGLEDGVRIKLHKYPFKEYCIDKEACSECFGSEEYNIEGSGIHALLKSKDLFANNYFLTNMYQSKILFSVEYTEDIELLNPKILNIVDGNTRLDMGKLGVFKNEYWSFQNEWRYVLRFIPVGFKEFEEDSINNTQKGLRKIHEGIDLPFNYYLLDLDSSKFEKMEITLSPKISEGNRVLVQLLVEKYNSTARIKESELISKIR